MAREEVYKQCVLIRKTETGEHRTVSWIPSEKISVGCTLKLKDPITKEWLEGRWTVKSIGDYERSASEVKERIRLARRYRSTTDV